MTRWLDADLVAPGLDEAVRLAQYVAGGGAAAVHLLDDRYQHRVAAVGAPLERIPVESSMCVQVVRGDATIYTEDATFLDRFEGNVHTAGPAPIRLYLATPLRDEEGGAVGTLCVYDQVARPLTAEQQDRLEDIASQVSQQFKLAALARRLADDALRDPLTGVANRVLMSERLAQALERSRRDAGRPAVALIDLDGFKQINDDLGHAVGDTLLIELARRLSAAVRGADTVARLGGDEFVVIVDLLPEDAGADAVRERLCAVFATPFKLGIREIAVNGSVGVVVPEPGELTYEVLGRADMAMYEEKRRRATAPAQRAPERSPAQQADPVG